jgi:glycine/serine hydroxymethyltransferase
VRVINEIKKYQLPADKAQIKDYLIRFRNEIKENNNISQVKKEVVEFCKKFPLYTTLDY